MNPIHEKTYTEGVAGIVHRSRLKRLLSIIKNLELPAFGCLGDFGCSNGFIIESIRGKNAYSGFFVNGKSEASYLKALLLRKRVDGSRDASTEQWGVHLGFDLRTLEGLLPRPADHSSSFFGFNHFYVIQG